MGKRSPTRLSVEVIFWKDAQKWERTKGPTGPLPLLVTTGLLIHEDEEQVVMGQELEASRDFIEREKDSVQIPKAMIHRRLKRGYVDVVMDSEEEEKDDSTKEPEGTSRVPVDPASGD